MHSVLSTYRTKDEVHFLFECAVYGMILAYAPSWANQTNIEFLVLFVIVSRYGDMYIVSSIWMLIDSFTIEHGSSVAHIDTVTIVT
jgi:hypothetical protein